MQHVLCSAAGDADNQNDLRLDYAEQAGSWHGSTSNHAHRMSDGCASDSD